MRYIAQAVISLGLLIGLPIFLDAPETLEWQIAAVIAALILAGLAFRAIVGFVNSRRPKRYADSVMITKGPPRKSG